MIISVPAKDDPRCINVDIPVQLHLVIEVTYVHSMNTNDISHSKHMREVLWVLCKELH
jgi:hypothetical protein